MCCNLVEEFESFSKGGFKNVRSAMLAKIDTRILTLSTFLSIFSQAAEKLKITATELTKLQIADGVIPVIFTHLFAHYLNFFPSFSCRFSNSMISLNL